MGKKGREFIILILASWVLIFLGTETTYARDFNLTPRSNGTVWIEFGTGIIDSCKWCPNSFIMPPNCTPGS